MQSLQISVQGYEVKVNHDQCFRADLSLWIQNKYATKKLSKQEKSSVSWRIPYDHVWECERKKSNKRAKLASPSPWMLKTPLLKPFSQILAHQRQSMLISFQTAHSTLLVCQEPTLIVNNLGRLVDLLGERVPVK